MTRSTDHPVSRREIVGAGAALAAVSLGSATAKGNEAMAQELTNPAEKYPKPPFKKQSQPWPGLASKMDPRPDHGEHSYRGSGRLLGRKALITGGDSGMGRAAAIAFAREERASIGLRAPIGHDRYSDHCHRRSGYSNLVGGAPSLQALALRGAGSFLVPPHSKPRLRP